VCNINYSYWECTNEKYDRLNKTKMRLGGVEYEISFHIEAL